MCGAGIPTRGQACARTVEFLDLYPTLADLAGVSAPAGVQGRSLTPLLKEPGSAWDHPALTQVQRGVGAESFKGYSVRTERWRYTEWDAGKKGVELYDEVGDPYEMRNLADDPVHRGTVADLQRVLRRMIGE
jgi:uncharacterized sulfatase